MVKVSACAMCGYSSCSESASNVCNLLQSSSNQEKEQGPSKKRRLSLSLSKKRFSDSTSEEISALEKVLYRCQRIWDIL